MENTVSKDISEISSYTGNYKVSKSELLEQVVKDFRIKYPKILKNVSDEIIFGLKTGAPALKNKQILEQIGRGVSLLVKQTKDFNNLDEVFDFLKICLIIFSSSYKLDGGIIKTLTKVKPPTGIATTAVSRISKDPKDSYRTKITTEKGSALLKDMKENWKPSWEKLISVFLNRAASQQDIEDLMFIIAHIKN